MPKVAVITWINEELIGILNISAIVSTGIGKPQPPKYRTETSYAEGIGLAFQIIDDILDVTASSETLGKTAGKDLLADKTTYPKLLGLEESKKRALNLVKKAKEAIIPWGEEANYLLSLADLITNRDR